MTGVRRRTGSRRTSCSRPKPSRRGIMMSDRIRSGGRAAGRLQRRRAVAGGLAPPSARRPAARCSRACRRCRRRPGSARARRRRRARARPPTAAGAIHRSASSTNGAAPTAVTAAGVPSVRLRQHTVRRQVRRAQRDPDRERRPLPVRAGDLDGAAVQLDRDPCTSARPMPVPSCVRACAPSTRWNRSKRRGTSWAGTPIPVSLTVSRAKSASRSSSTAIPPRSVNFNAFDSRLKTIFSHRSRST